MQIRMDWSAISFDWNHARAFLVTAREGSLSAAARALGTTQPTLGRQVAAFQAELGVTLFERAGRGLELTESGANLAETIAPMADAARHVSLTASGQSQSVEGLVRITASEIYASHLLPPMLGKLREKAPGITIEIIATNRVTDLRRREADVAIRNARPNDPELFARKIAEDHATFYATPGYIDRIGHPDSLGDLARADFIGFEDIDGMMAYLTEYGLTLTARNFPIVSESHVAQLGAALNGLGIAIVPSHVGDADPRLVRVLPDAPPITFPIWLVAHRELRTARRVRLVFDHLAEELERLGQPG